MQLTIVGGGGFRVPLVYRALTDQGARPVIDGIVIYDADPTRARAMHNVIGGLPSADGPTVRVAGDLDEALTGADIVFSALRAGGTSGRVLDERIALQLGVLGQETTGPGGISYALRSIPASLHLAERVAVLAPDAWVINFTNPAGMVTEAMQRVLGERVIGVCDSPIGLVRRAARAAGLELDSVTYDYAGLNHLGWLRSLRVDGADVLPGLIADPARLATFEEGRLFGPALLRLLGCVPNEYLYYYYFTRDVVAALQQADQTRGEFLVQQQDELYPQLLADPRGAYERWEAARLGREAGYLAEARAPDELRDEADLAGGGYEQVALAVMQALLGGDPARLILNVRNGEALIQLPVDAVVEVPTIVDSGGVHPQHCPPFDHHQLGLVSALKAVEQATIEAAITGSRSAALRALTLHPLVDSATVARDLLNAYLAAFPELAELLAHP